MNATPPPPSPRPCRRWALGAGAVLVLALVFLAYRNPHLAVDLANRAWSCF